MLATYKEMAREREAAMLPPLPLNPQQTLEVVSLLEKGDGDREELLELLMSRVEPGVSKSAKVKALWLQKVASATVVCDALKPVEAVEILARMGGGYNVEALIELLSLEGVSSSAAKALRGITKIYDGFDKIAELSKTSKEACDLIDSWARAEWFIEAAPVPDVLELRVYKVDGEINTDDFSPGNQAQSRADIPLHATHFGVSRFPGGIEEIKRLKKEGGEVAFAGDVVGTGSSRKSAVNSLLWHIGHDIAGVPNKRSGGVVLGGTIAPIFYATARDAGVLPIECDVAELCVGDTILVDLKNWKMQKDDGTAIAMRPASPTLLDEYRAGGRLNLIIGKQLTRMACDFSGKPFPQIFASQLDPKPQKGQGFSLAQKMVGKACGLPGVLPGTVCEPKMTTVGSQDTTGPMTMQEIDELACLRFKADLFMQSFCHTAAYPKASDFDRWQIMQETSVSCGGITLKPGDGVIHPWLNKMLVPDTVGTGGDSHTRFPLGISFPAGSGLVAFAAALGFMPLEMPESVLVRFHGKRKAGITVRDMVNAIPYVAIKKGLLTVEKKGKKNVFAGKILEIEGVNDLSVEEAFELTDASAERSAAGCAVSLPLETVVANVEQNVKVLQLLVDENYQDRDCLQRRIDDLKQWLKNPTLLRADENAVYDTVIDIDLSEITEPILACPNDPDDVRLLGEVVGDTVEEAFIGSCMTHMSHLQRAAILLDGEKYAKARLWIAPSTRLDREAVRKEGALSVFSKVGARVEIPGCSLCMGNQARVAPETTVISTSTRNFDNRLGDNTRVYLASTELTAISGLLGEIPTVEHYFDFIARKKVQ
ncbi:bifunctional aconitate hydratase 2/2-methylisocitrate dehydratase [Desulforhopalus singaporensis]|uniref:Aconitate hydratase B n=1 Tax=Desulforhopalus singaporensis TaxID=91360 RepID=A0A1H0S3W1_9BACT|nr:bifunctional aconitate hydratase 2/2-methylisocitrate dehydratase [Desulforhopalus singaporensis]SDP36420.1 aconitase [Desulforhopalus singaporensis]